MAKTTIHLVTGIQGMILLVFHTEAHSWQFRIVRADGVVFGERKLYYSAEAAEKAGRDWIV